MNIQYHANYLLQHIICIVLCTTFSYAQQKELSTIEKNRLLNSKMSNSGEKDALELNYILTEIYQKGINDSTYARISSFQKKYPDTIYRPLIDEALQRREPFKRGKTAPLFCLYDSLGAKYCLNQFKGKVVYIDFWIHYCSPCIANMKLIEENFLQEKKLANNVFFININMDKDRQEWIKALKKHKLSGIQLWCGQSREQIKNDYDIAGLPLALLIDKNGNIYQYNPPLARINNGEFLKKLLLSVSNEL